MHEGEEANLTWAGRRLLKPRYLDELPQIWNVFRGDMSLVGPRPWPPPMVANQVAKGITYRNEIVAGWTGPAQVEKGVTESPDTRSSTSRTSSSVAARTPGSSFARTSGSSGERSWSWRRAKGCASERRGGIRTHEALLHTHRFPRPPDAQTAPTPVAQCERSGTTPSIADARSGLRRARRGGAGCERRSPEPRRSRQPEPLSRRPRSSSTHSEATPRGSRMPPGAGPGS